MNRGLDRRTDGKKGRIGRSKNEEEGRKGKE